MRTGGVSSSVAVCYRCDLFWSVSAGTIDSAETEKVVDRMINERIEEGFEVFLSDGGKPFAAVREVAPHGRPEMIVYVENAGDYTIGVKAVTAVHSQKVIVDYAKLDTALQQAISHAYDAEDPNV